MLTEADIVQIVERSMKSSWHGFKSFVDFAKSMFWLIGAAAPILYFALTFTLDPRYARADIQDTVRLNNKVATAVKGDVELLTSQVTGLRRQLMSEKLFELKIRVCAHTAGDTFWAREFRDLKAEYRSFTGEYWVEPSCEELL